MSEQNSGSGDKIRYSSSGVDFESTPEEDLNWWELRQLARKLNQLFTGEKANRAGVKKAHDALASASTTEDDSAQS